MTESPTPSKFAKWKRTFIGGMLSALVAGVVWIITIYGEDSPFVLLSPSFAGMPAMILNAFSEKRIMLDDFPVWFLVVGFWFIVGAIIAYSTKTNKKAVWLWLLVLLLLTPFSYIYVFMLSG